MMRFVGNFYWSFKLKRSISPYLIHILCLFLLSYISSHHAPCIISTIQNMDFKAEKCFWFSLQKKSTTSTT